MIKFFKNLSIPMKVVMIAIPIAVASAIGVFAYKKTNTNSIQAVSAALKNVQLEETILPEIEEEVVVVAKDTTIDEPLKEKEVTFDNMTVEVPKSKVAPKKSKEDPENNRKKGGAEVSQADTAAMFENAGVKSYGIDVSSWQGNINWAAVRASGIDFAMIRVGYRGYGTGAIMEDAYFKQNVNGAVANGVKVGIYFYSAAVNEEEALQEAAWTVSKIQTYRITYPVVYDFEEFNRNRCANVDGAQATRNALTFLNYVQSKGYEPMIYGNKTDIGRMGRGSFSCKFWLAHYTSQTDYGSSYNMWQYTSSGSVPGISGRVDMNVAFFSYGETANAKHTHDYTEFVASSSFDATCTKEGKKVMRCSCGEVQETVIPKLDHTFGKWEIVEEATEETEGLKKRTCSKCNTEETEKIEKLTHKHEWVIDETIARKEPTCTETGIE